VNVRRNNSGRVTRVAEVCMAAAIVVCLMTLPAQAHKVNVFAYVEGDRVIVEGYFSGNAKAQDSLVQIIDETGKKLLEGKTDKKRALFLQARGSASIFRQP